MNFARLAAIAEQVVKSAQRRLPAEVRQVAKAMPVCYESHPNATLQADGVESDVLGLFVGQEYGRELESDSVPLPAQILLFLENIWDQAERDESIYRDEVQLTYLHELGHYLGWDEDEIARRGLD